MFTLFMSSGSMSKAGSSGIEFPVVILRDTAASHSLLLRGSCYQVEEYYTGESTIIDGVGGPIQVPYARIYLDSSFRTGYVTVAVTDRIPLEGIDLLLGNDIEGEQVFPNIKVTEFPSDESPTKQLEKEYPELFPVCAVTRKAKMSQSLGSSHPGSESIFDADVGTEIGRLFNGEKVTTVADSSVGFKVDVSNLPITKEKLILRQEQDQSLARG